MLSASRLTFALTEEIGDTNLFTGRKADLDYLFRWLEGVRKKNHPSLAIMARRKKGKTALVQRFYNILFTMNDPQIIPFYYKVKEWKNYLLPFADEFYLSFLSQYAAFKTRDATLLKKKLLYSDLKEVFRDDQIILDDIVYMERVLAMKDPNKAWEHATWAGERISVQKNEQIIQIIDEFQYMNEYIYIDINGQDRSMPLCGTYHHVGASKISPVIITGSYMARLSHIIRRMTGRYAKFYLKNLPDEEAVEMVYNYSRCMNVPVTEETAAYMAKVSHGDTFYISRFFNTDYLDRDLTSIECINQIIFHETRIEEFEYGYITEMWMDYLRDAIQRINDVNGKKIILYLVKHDGEEKTRPEITEDLGLDMTEEELGRKLESFIHADILSYGQTISRYRGLGDRYFNLIFRSLYQEEIENFNLEEIRAISRKELRSVQGKLSVQKGIAMEESVHNKFLIAINKKIPLSDLLSHYIKGFELAEIYDYTGKKRFNINESDYIEVDIYLHTEESQGNDFVIEVKNWEKPVTKSHVKKFIKTKQLLSPMLKPDTGFIFYSHKPLPEDLLSLLRDNDIMVMNGLTGQ
jgi:hypothetical protein